MFVMVIVLVQAGLQILLSQLYPPMAVYDYSDPDVTNLVCDNHALSSIFAFGRIYVCLCTSLSH